MRGEMSSWHCHLVAGGCRVPLPDDIFSAVGKTVREEAKPWARQPGCLFKCRGLCGRGRGRLWSAWNSWAPPAVSGLELSPTHLLLRATHWEGEGVCPPLSKPPASRATKDLLFAPPTPPPFFPATPSQRERKRKGDRKIPASEPPQRGNIPSKLSWLNIKQTDPKSSVQLER